MKRNQPRIIGSLALLRGSVAEFRAGWKIYVGTAAVLIVPIQLLNLSSALANSLAFGAYVIVATLILNLVLLRVAGRRLRGDLSDNIRSVYFDGTGSLIEYVITLVVVGVSLFPLVIGVVLFEAGSSQGASIAEELVVGLVALIPSIIGFLIVLFTLFSPVVTVNQHTRPLKSLAIARGLVKGRYWAVAGRVAVLSLFLIIVFGLIYGLIVLIALVVHNASADNFILQVATGLIWLTLFNISTAVLYKNLMETVAE